MTGEREIDYEALAQGAMRGIVRAVLTRVAKTGLPGEHHFYIAFKTDAPGVSLSKRLKEKYPEEMTVVLQHRFWDLAVNEERFEVKLTFDGIPERLVVPFAAIKVFFDPSVPYALQFEETAVERRVAHPVSAARGAGPRAEGRKGEPAAPPPAEAGRTEKKPRTGRKTQPEKGAEASAPVDEAAAKLPATKPAQVPASGPKVVSIDAFRKK